MEKQNNKTDFESWKDGLVLNSSNNSFKDRLLAVKAILSLEYINTLIGFSIFMLIVSMVIFGYVWKNMFIMKLIVVLFILFMVAMLAAKHFWYPQEETKKKKSKSDEPGIMDQISEVLPNSQDYDKNMEKAFKI